MEEPRIAVVGGGALGGVIAARLAAAVRPVTLVVRPHRVETLSAHGINLIEPDRTRTVRVPVLPGTGPLPLVDIVVVAVKAHHLADAAGAIRRLIGPDTVLVSVLNGLQWWMAGEFGGPLRSLDPGGDLLARLPPARVIACVPYWACSMREVPERIEHHLAKQTGRLVLGPADPDAPAGDRVQTVVAAFESAGLNPVVSPEIRREIWFKVWPWAAVAPMSVVHECPFGALTDHPDRLARIERVMGEVAAVARCLGQRFEIAARDRLAIMERDGIRPHRPSMLQDYQSGRRLELEPLAGAVVELGDRLGTDPSALRQLCHEVRDKVAAA